MIELEYIIAQHQDGNASVAIKSKKVKQQNPAIRIIRTRNLVEWHLVGLNLGEIETIEGQSRVSRVDFYIGFEDLIHQRNLFPASTGTIIPNTSGVGYPIGSVRVGGTPIRLQGTIERMIIEDVNAIIPTYKLTKNINDDLILNLDRESSPYPIVAENGNRTTRQLHFGIEHDYNVRNDNRLSTPRICLTFTEDQYATVLNIIDNAIIYYQTH
jgi:hypothetical protein